MKIGILSKRTHKFTGKIKDFFEQEGHNVEIFTANNLCINKSLLENDFYILKSKKLFYFYAAYFLEANNIPVIPDPNNAFKQKHRIGAQILIKKAGLLAPEFFMGSIETLKKKLNKSNYPLIVKPIMGGSGSRGIKVIKSYKDLNFAKKEIIYAERFIKGIHYIVYFIGDEICALEKLPLKNEHSEMNLITLSDDLKVTIIKWQKKYDLLFGHLDIVREEITNKLYIVDPG
ncbi:MAG: RimK family alpha-L-glutamate ligase, partial [Promethearchaeota archaeon]